MEISAQIEKFAKEIDSKLPKQLKGKFLELQLFGGGLIDLASLVDRIHVWISVPSFANDLERARKEKENGTSE
jgi:hypothetical protein